LVSAGPTRAYLDPVRFVSNASTGAMGFAIAAQAARAGAEVVLVAGPVSLETPPGVRRIDIETAGQLLDAMDQELGAAPFDLVAMAAAVSDLAPNAASGKLEKEALLDHLRTLTWSKETDVLATLAARHGGKSHFMGFAAQTLEDADPPTIEARLVALATEKLRRKGVPCVFVNRVGVPETGFQSPTNAGWLVVAREDAVVSFGSGAPRPKAELATWLLETYAREVLRVPSVKRAAVPAAEKS
jgi:phosphopantothenoylcysteine decarboxylase/phosphopantothenate--cysteine ligase